MKSALLLLSFLIGPYAMAGMSWSTPQCHDHQIYLKWMHEGEALTPEQSLELQLVKGFICESIPKDEDFGRKCLEHWEQEYDKECSPNY